MVSVLCKGSPRQRLLAQRADYTCNTVVVQKEGARKWGDCSTPGRGARRQTYEEVEDPGPRTLHRRGQEQKGWGSLYTHNRKGIEICRLYGEGKCGTKAPQVQEGCDLCLGPHMSSECPGCWQLTRRAGWFRWATSHAGPPHTPHQRGSDASSSKKPRTPSPTASLCRWPEPRHRLRRRRRRGFGIRSWLQGSRTVRLPSGSMVTYWSCASSPNFKVKPI